MLKRSILEDSFFEFVKHFWDVIVPEDPVWNWHIEYICDEKQKVAERVFNNQPKEYDLVINVPPGSTKSIICSEMFAPWTWINMPTARHICGSYSGTLSLELARKSLKIVQSEEYIELFGLALEKEATGHFVNTHGGDRYAKSTRRTCTGYHAHFIDIDDPLNPLEASSEVGLKNANTWMRETLPSRKVDKDVSVTSLIMQRLNEGDCTADKLSLEKVNVKHINLPAEIDDRNTKTVRPRALRHKYVDDPEREGYKLLDPVRLSRRVLDEARSALNEYGYAGQFLQQPVPLSGGMFKTGRIKIEEPPISANDWIQKCRFWDKAGTEGGGAYTVGVLMGEDAQHRFWVLDVVRGQWDTGERETIIKQTAKRDGVDVVHVRIGIEQEPGSGGKESAQSTISNLRGFDIEAIRPSGDKIIRAMPFSSQINIGNVYMIPAEWNQAYLNELTLFPNSKYKDQVDASSGAFTLLTFSETKRVGVF